MSDGRTNKPAGREQNTHLILSSIASFRILKNLKALKTVE
jgi:hypothetical protein